MANFKSTELSITGCFGHQRKKQMRQQSSSNGGGINPI